MRKTIIIIGVFVLSLFALTDSINAQGTFNCRYIAGPGACQLDQNNCASGFTPDATLCPLMSGNPDLCNGTKALPLGCIPIQTAPPAQNNRYGCEVDTQNGTCVVAPGNTCVSGYAPGSQCGSLTLGNCQGATFSCVQEQDGCGTPGKNCCAGSTCSQGSCNTATNKCEACGTQGLTCCPGPFGCQESGKSLKCNSANICELIGVEADPVNFTTCDAQGGEGIPTAIGCIPITSMTALTTFVLRWGLGIAGGIALLMIVVAGYMTMTSQGDPKRLQSGQELMTSAISGLLLLIFSIFILRLIGVNVLGLF